VYTFEDPTDRVKGSMTRNAWISITIFFVIILTFPSQVSTRALANSSTVMPGLASIIDNSMIEIPQPISSEVVTGIVETENLVLLRTNKGIRRSTDSWQTWNYVYNGSFGNETWPVFKHMVNGWLFSSNSYQNESHQLVSKDNGNKWISMGASDPLPISKFFKSPMNELVQLPNGTYLSSQWGDDDGGLIYKSNDGENWRLAWNLTVIGQNLGWLNSSEKHRHAHHIHYDPYMEVIIAVGGEMSSGTRDIGHMYFSKDMGVTWKLGMWTYGTELISTPYGVFVGCDNHPDIQIWRGEEERGTNLRVLRNNNLDTYVFRGVYKNGVLFFGTDNRHPTDYGYGLLASVDLESYVVLKNHQLREGAYDVFDGVADNLYLLRRELQSSAESFTLYRMRALSKDELVQYVGASNEYDNVYGRAPGYTSVNQPHYMYNVFGNAKLRLVGKNVTNPIQNPGFEGSWTPTFYGFDPDKWSLATNCPSGDYIIDKGEDAHTGTYSLELNTTFDLASGGTFVLLYTDPPLTLKANTEYAWDFWGKSNTTVDGSMESIQYPPDLLLIGNQIGVNPQSVSPQIQHPEARSLMQQADNPLYVSTRLVSSRLQHPKIGSFNPRWERYVYRFKTTNYTSYYLYVGFSGSSGHIHMLIDDCMLVEGREAYPFIIGTQQTQNPTVYVEGRPYSHLGTLNDGEYEEWTIGNIVGTENVTITAQGSGVATIQFLGDDVGTSNEIILTPFSDRVLGGVYYGSLNSLSSPKFIVLSSSNPDEYANIKDLNYSNSQVNAIFTSPKARNTTVKVYSGTENEEPTYLLYQPYNLTANYDASTRFTTLTLNFVSNADKSLAVGFDSLSYGLRYKAVVNGTLTAVSQNDSLWNYAATISTTGDKATVQIFMNGLIPKWVKIDNAYLKTTEWGYNRYSDIMTCNIEVSRPRALALSFWSLAWLRPVGGVLLPANKVEILTPYLAMAGLIAVVSMIAVVRKRSKA
jgi:hypothetical protein